MRTKLLQKYISGDATNAEREQVVKWLDADKAHMEKYIKMRKAYDALVWIDEDQTSTQTIGVNNRRTNRLILWIGRIASGVAIILLSIFIYERYGGDYLGDNQMVTMIIPAGQYGELVLADNSRVWLNSKSKLEFPSTFRSDKREVYLDGEAFFDVEADENSPFVVHTSDFSVEALGTEFNVNSFSNGDNSTTSLLSGKVNVRLKNKDESYELTPNQEIEYKEGEVDLRLISHLSQFEWKNGVISIEDEPMESLLEILGHYYGVEIEIRNTSILKDKYTGKFKIKDGVEQALRVLQLRSDFTYKKKGDHIIIED